MVLPPAGARVVARSGSVASPRSPVSPATSASALLSVSSASTGIASGPDLSRPGAQVVDIATARQDSQGIATLTADTTSSPAVSH